MRTKSLNLKKKIAFIASVAMLASTVAYLPADLVKDIGIGNGVVASAEAAGGVVAGEYEDADGVAAANAIDTMDVFVQIDGKYLCINNDGEYTLKNTFNKNDSTVKYVNAAAAFTANAGVDNDPYHEATDKIYANGGLLATTPSAYEVLKQTADTALEIPYIANATTVILEFVPKRNAILSSRSITEVEIPLNEYGIGRLGKQTEYAVGRSNTSNYDETTDFWKKVGTADAEKAEGSYEVIDLSNFVVSMQSNNKNDNKFVSKAFDAANIVGNTNSNVKITKVNSDTKNANVNITLHAKPNETPYAVVDEDKIYADTYEVKKVNGVYARVISGTLTDAVKPGDTVTIDTAMYSTYTATGASSGKVTVTMGNDGYGVSGLVTMTSGSNKEYYVYVIKNHETTLTKAQEEQLSFDMGYSNDNLTGNLYSSAKYNEYDQYKVKKTTVTEKVGNENVYVSKYTIYTNETKTMYDGVRGDDKPITIILAGADDKESLNFAGSAGSELALTGNGTVLQNNKQNNTTISDTTIDNQKVAQTVTIDRTDVGKAFSEVLKFTYANGKTEYVEFEFTNEYDIKYDNNYDDARTDATKNYDGTVSVTGKTVASPGTVNKPGFEFRGWKAVTGKTQVNNQNVLTTAYVYDVNNGSEQLEGTLVTPNTVLRADFESLRYNVELDGNGGYIDKATADTAANPAASITTYEYFPGNGTKLGAKASLIGNETDVNELYTDVKNYTKINAVKTGYTWLGWSTDNKATKAMTTKEIAAAFPGENKTLTLYAVYEAKKELTAKFQMIPFAETGSNATTDGKIATNSIFTVWKTADTTDATFEKASDKVKNFNVGEKLGTLPTPYAKGYEFEGWYAKTFSSNLTNVTATKVTADTVLDGNILHEETTGDTSVAGTNGTEVQETNVYLYAKFTPKTYNITFDIGDGAWANAKVADDEEGNLPATFTFNGGVNKGANLNRFTFKRADGSTLTYDPDMKEVANPKVGSDTITKFKNWTINNSRTTYSTLDDVYAALDNDNTFKSLEDITIKANYKTDSDSKESNINLNANEGAFYTYKISEKSTTTKKPTKFYAYNAAGAVDTAADYDYDKENANPTYKTIANFQKTTLNLANGTAGLKVDTKWTVNSTSAMVEEVSGTYGYQVARPGYEFTGWYTDKECTNLYTFDAYPEEGKETILYAGWKPISTVRYFLDYELFNEDTSLATDSYDPNSTLTGRKTFYATMGTTLDARNLTVTVKSGTGTNQTTTKYVFDEGLSSDLDFTTNELKCDYDVASLAKGKFEQDENYTFVQGRFMEESGATPVATLGTATNVKADNGTVTFTAAANADHYKVQKTYTTGGTTKTALGAAFTGTSGSYKVPTEGSSYKIAVIAYNADESKSTVSAAVTVNISAAATVGKATNLKVDNGTVTFTAAANADHYKVQKTYTNAQGKEVTAKGSAFTGTKGTFSVPAQGDYKIAVIAYDKNETQAVVSGTVTVKAAATTTMDAVDDSTITVDTATGKVSWSAAKGAKYYKVFKIVKENGKEKTYWGSKVSDTSYTFKNLPTDDFKVYVAAISEDGNTVKYSAKVKVSLLPAATNVKISSDKKTVSWTKVTGDKADKIVKYQVAKFNPDTNTTDYSVKVDASESSITMKNAAKSGIKIFVLAFDADGNSSYSQSITVE